MKCRYFNLKNESILIRKVLLGKKIFPLLASLLFLASCDASDLRPKRGRPPPRVIPEIGMPVKSMMRVIVFLQEVLIKQD